MSNKIVENQIVKSGYLIKSARGTLTGWKKRYFILNGSTITYFGDHNNLSKAKGDLLLTQDSQVEDVSLSGKAFCVRITTPFSSLVIATKDENERTSWKNAIESSIHRCKTSLRSYITKKGSLIEGKTRRFFILVDDTITFHKDHEHTGEILGAFKIGPETKMNYSDEFCKINLSQGSDESSALGLRFLQSTDEYFMWKTALLSLVASPSGTEDVAFVEDTADSNTVLKKGKLKMRPVKGGELWDDFNFLLTPSAMIALDEITGTQVIETFPISPSCSVFETNLGRNAFELVTPKKVLHVLAENREATSSWIKILRETISNSKLETKDPLLINAMEKMKDDVIYNVSFHEDKPLGVVLERSGEWAIVKLANERDTGVIVGSALMAVNSEDVMFAKYQETIGRLKNWRPPLTLTFLKSPEKRGFLVKESRGRHGTQRNWKRRYFVIEQGRIYYKDKESNEGEIKGDIPLMGSAVSLASSQETGKFFCFRLVSGVTCLVMQAETFDELMDWASTLYHAIGIANGGAHILRVEYQKRTQSSLPAQPQKLDGDIHSGFTPAEIADANAKADLTVNDMIAKERAKLQGQVVAAEREPKEVPMAPTEVVVSPPSPPQESKSDAEVVLEAKADAESSEKDVEVASPAVAESSEPESPPSAAEDESITSARQALIEAQVTASLDDFSALAAALTAAHEAGLAGEIVERSSSLLANLQKEKAVLNEVNKALSDAVKLQSISALRVALRNAESVNVSNESTAEAATALAALLEAEEKKAAEEKARLEAEAAALDAELAAEEATARAAGGTDMHLQHSFSDEDDEEMDDSVATELVSPPALPNKRGSIKEMHLSSPPPSQIRLLAESGRKLASRSERIRRESLVPEEVDPEEGLNQITDEQLNTVFNAYAKISGTVDYPTLNVMQFSTIWRLITGVRGNLFQEMKIFNSFDIHNNGALSADDFRKGWRAHNKLEGGRLLAEKMLSLVGNNEDGGGNVLL